MSRQHLICGIDVGNSSIKTVIAEIDRDSLIPRIIGIGSADSRGLRRGMVFDINETVKNIAESVNQAQSFGNVNITRAYVSLSGPHIKTHVSRGVIAVSRADSHISQGDIDRVMEAASVISLPPNREIIHVLPRFFIIDGQEQVKNPLGMKGVRLEAEVFIIEGLSTYIHNLAQCISSNNIEVADFVYSPIAVSLSALDRQQKEYGVLNLDFGGGTSTFALFHEGDLVHTGVLPIGSRHITNDLAVLLRTSMDIAEQVKKDHGRLEDSVSKKDLVDLSEIIGEEDFTLPRREITKIIEARVAELFDMVSSELKRVPKQHLLPGGLVITGGGANLTGLSDFAKTKLKLPVRINTNYFINSEIMHERSMDPSFAVSAGLIHWGFEKEFSGHAKSIRKQIFSSSNNIFGRLGAWLKNFMP